MALTSKSFRHRAIREATLLYAFTRRDWTVTLVPGCTFALPAIREIYHRYQSPIQPAFCLLSVLTWLILYIYSFNLSNQLFSIEEDRLNKPDRPLCRGLVTLQGARTRAVLISVFFLASALIWPLTLTPTLVWIFTTIFLCFTSYGNHWLGKNTIGMTLGTWSLLAGAWRAAGPTTPGIDRQMLYFSLWVGLTSQIQDLRDIKGDIAVGRWTLPIAFGDKSSRWLIAFGFVPAALLLLVRGGFMGNTPLLGLMIVMHVILAYRVLRAEGRENAKYDHNTYKVMIMVHFVVYKVC
jgi:4-hydroxybenzoate polyprenyltransferase